MSVIAILLALVTLSGLIFLSTLHDFNALAVDDAAAGSDVAALLVTTRRPGAGTLRLWVTRRPLVMMRRPG